MPIILDKVRPDSIIYTGLLQIPSSQSIIILLHLLLVIVKSKVITKMYCLQFREKVLSTMRKECLSVARRFGISPRSALNWTKKIAPRVKRNKPAAKIDMEALSKDVRTYPDAYQYERAERFGVSQKGVFEALKRLAVTYKKN